MHKHLVFIRFTRISTWEQDICLIGALKHLLASKTTLLAQYEKRACLAVCVGVSELISRHKASFLKRLPLGNDHTGDIWPFVVIMNC